MSNNPNILVFIDWFWPGYLAGGPVQSIVSMVSYLHEKVNFKIVTTNTDLNSDVAYPGIAKNTWVKSPLGCEVYYADKGKIDQALILQIMSSTKFDAVYINSFFSKMFSIVPLQLMKRNFKGGPVILAPRGMLGKGALSIKRYKKQAFIFYAKLTGLHKNVLWHATSEQEAHEIADVFGQGSDIMVIPNLPKKITAGEASTKDVGSIKLCFISRISEKKNLLFALEVLAEIKDAQVSYEIYGPMEDENYWNRCKAVIDKLPSNIKVVYKGALEPAQVEKVLASQHMLFLPTLNENFGHAIVESLLSGCPVLISDQTPWSDLEKGGAGFAFPLSQKHQFVECIKGCAKFNAAEFNTMRANATKYITGKLDTVQIVKQYENIFYDQCKD